MHDTSAQHLMVKYGWRRQGECLICLEGRMGEECREMGKIG